MAKNKKVRKVKKSPAQSQRARAKDRAQTLINRIGHRMGFLGGMAWLGTQVIGMQEAVSGNTSVSFKETLAEELQSNLRNRKRDWTLAIAFVSEVDDEVTIKTISKVFENTTPVFLDDEGTRWLFDQSETMWDDNTFASLWITVPSVISDADAIFEEFDDELEEMGAFSREHIANITDQRRLKASIQEGKDGVTLRDRAHAIAKELQDAGYPISIRLINIGRRAYSNDDLPDDCYIDIRGVGGTLVSTYLDESVVQAEEIKLPDNFDEVIMEVAERVIIKGTKHDHSK